MSMALPEAENPLIFVTGATGCVGGRLVPTLLNAGYPVRLQVGASRELQVRCRGCSNTAGFTARPIKDWQAVHSVSADEQFDAAVGPFVKSLEGRR